MSQLFYEIKQQLNNKTFKRFQQPCVQSHSYIKTTELIFKRN